MNKQLPENALNARPVTYGTQFELPGHAGLTFILVRFNGKIEKYSIQDGLEMFAGYL